MYRRIVNLPLNNSFFLFGPRGTGKSTLLETVFLRELSPAEVLVFDLLDPDLEEELKRRPARLRERIEAHPGVGWVVIDEVQKLPALLDVVHQLIESKRIRFALTGSSARKLKRGGANLLAGRAFEFKLHPLTHMELGADFDLQSTLEWGTLPSIFSFPDALSRGRYLKTYVRTYLQEEILLEQIVRNVDGFRNFLEVAAQTNGKILNYAKIARDCNMDDKSVARFFEILRDTLVGFFLEPYGTSVRKRQAQKPKFLFFDIGVVRAITKEVGHPLPPHSYAFGNAFEQFIILEALRLNDYFETDFSFSYLRTKDGVEIDLIVNRPHQPQVLIEIKSAATVGPEDLRALNSLGQEFPDAEKWVLCREQHARRASDCWILPWRQGLARMYGREDTH